MELYNTSNTTVRIPKYRYAGQYVFKPGEAIAIPEEQASFFKPYAVVGIVARATVKPVVEGKEQQPNTQEDGEPFVETQEDVNTQEEVESTEDEEVEDTEEETEESEQPQEGEESAVETETTDYESMKFFELKKAAKDAGIKVSNKAKREEIIELLKGNK